MDNTVPCNVIVKEEPNEDDNPTCPVSTVPNNDINESMAVDCASEREDNVPDFLSTVPEISIKEERADQDAITHESDTVESVLPLAENNAIKEEITDTDISEEELPSSREEFEPSCNSLSVKRITSAGAISTRYGRQNAKTSRLVNKDSKPGTSAKDAAGKNTRSRSVCGTQDSGDPNDPDPDPDPDLDPDEAQEPQPFRSVRGPISRGEGSGGTLAKTDFPNCDDLLYCVDCKCAWEGDCPEHGPLIVVDDTEVPRNTSDNLRSERTAPLLVKIDETKKVVAALSLLNRTRFGPFEGIIGPPVVVNKYTRPIFKNGKLDHCIDASDPASSNWMRFVRCTDDAHERNLDAYQYKGQVYFRTIRRISRGEELVVSRETSKGLYRQYIHVKEEPGQDVDDDFSSAVGGIGVPPLKNYDALSKSHFPEVVETVMSEGPHPGLFYSTDGSSQNVQVKLYVCKECNKAFRKRLTLKKHLRKHDEEKPHVCKECSRRFSTESSLEAHMRTHSELTIVVECTVCNERFTNEDFLREHTRSHSGQKLFVCTVCNQRFARKYTLSMHIRTHTNERPYECPVCKLQFAVKVNLQSHERIHAGYKPFVCPECNRSFGRKSHLTGHMRVHSGEKPFACSMCDQRFLHKHNQMKHERTHTKARPFGCPECPQRFCYKSHLKEHLRVHTGGAAYAGPILKDGPDAQ